MFVLISRLPCSLVLCQQFQWNCCCQALWCRRGVYSRFFSRFSAPITNPHHIPLSAATMSHPPATSIQSATTTSPPPSSSLGPATSPSHPLSSSPRPATSRKRKNRLASAKDAKRRKDHYQKLNGNIREGIIFVVFNCLK